MAGKHVLIVDDDMEFVKLYSLFLKNSGLKVSAVYSAGEALGAIEEHNPDIMVLDVMMEHFDSGFNVSKSVKEKHPDRFFEMYIAEQNMVDVESGLATLGFIRFTTRFAVFSTYRDLDQIRVVVSQPALHVIIVGAYSGIQTGKTGKTHQASND